METKKFKVFRVMSIKVKAGAELSVIIDNYREVTEDEYNSIMKEHLCHFPCQYRVWADNHEYLSQISNLRQELSETENILNIEYLHYINL